MNDTNPFIPQGSLLEQKNKKRARVKVAVLAIFGINVVLISTLLFIPACRHGDQAATDQDTNTDTSMAATASNLPPALTTSNLAMSTTLTNPVQPPVSQVPTATIVADTTEYVILPKDTYSSIAKKFPGLTAKALMAANPDVPPTKLMPGKKIKIPPSTAPMAVAGGPADAENLYVVKPNDNLFNIARSHSTTVKAIQDLNNLKTTRITAGQKLKLPVKVAQSTGMTPDSAPATTTASNPMQSSGPTMR